MPPADHPKYPPSEQMGAKGMRMVQHRVEEYLGWVFRDISARDFGIDAQVEVISSDNKATGRLLAAQVKCGPSFLKESAEGGFRFREDLNHLEYWLAYSLPVILVLCDPEADECWWVEVTEEYVRRTKKAWTIIVPKDQPLDRGAKQALQRLAKRPRPRRPAGVAAAKVDTGSGRSAAESSTTDSGVADEAQPAGTTGRDQAAAEALEETGPALRLELRTGEVIGAEPYTYTIETDAQLQIPGEIAVPLGSGGSSVVYRALFKQSMRRALKLLSPEPRLLKGIGRAAFTVSFEAEQDLLSRLTHTRVSKLADFGTLSIGEDDYLFNAMDLIEGEHLDEAIAGGDVSAREFLGVIDQLLDALSYLHDERVMHCDVKGANILVERNGGRCETTLVDLGVAKVVKRGAGASTGPEPHDPQLLERLGDVTVFNSSRKLMRREWRERLNRTITYSELDEMFPSHDLYAVGLLIDGALAPDAPMRDRLTTELSPDIVVGMETMRDRLLSPAGAEYYHSAARVQDDWRKLDPGYMAPLDVAELAAGGSGMTSLPLPGGRALLTPRARAAVTHPLMQRLRHLPQLELVSLLNPGATHTRLLHALATFEMAKRFILSLLGDPSFRLMADPIDIEAALLWALLHDVGHYPLSHMFEDLAEEERKFGRPRTIPTDDDLFFAFVGPAHVDEAFAAFAPAIAAAFAASDAQEKMSLEQYLTASGYSEATLKALWGIATRDTPARAVLSAALSSPIDVDKIAYLADDSRASGVGYGLGSDLDALLSSLRAPAENDIRLGEPLLAITDKALPAAEQIVLARYWMLRRVYWHRTNRSIIGMIKFVIRELRSANRLDMPAYVASHLFADADTAVRDLSKNFEEAARAGLLGGGGAMRNPLPGLLGGSRQLYKELIEIAFGPADADRELHKRLADLRPEDQPAVLADLENKIATSTGAEVRRGDVILDVPTKVREDLGAPVLVYPDRSSGSGVRLDRASPLLSSHRDEFTLHVRKSRVFVHPQLADAVAGEWDRVSAAARSVLRARFGL